MKKRKILVVDDQFTNRMILKKILEDDYEVIFAEDGKQAMEVLKEMKRELSAVLLDIQMPIMTGYGVLERMRIDDSLSSIPVIVTTQFQDEETEIKVLSYGATDFLSKPYKPAIIRQRLANTIKLCETSMLINMAQKDDLTGLFNKNYFHQRLQEELDCDSKTELDVIAIKLTKFKVFNEIFGIKMGEKYLKYVAKILQKHFDEGFLAHLGSGEFVVFVAHSEERDRNSFSIIKRDVEAFDIKTDSGICFGIFSDRRVKNAVVMTERAQLAVDGVRKNPATFFGYYDIKLREQTLLETEIASAFNDAIKKKQFEVYFQPKVRLETNEIVGAEALIRWNHPTKGFLYPGSFIPIFEKNNYISQLDYYVWDETCRRLRELIDLGYNDIEISVNVSRIDLYNHKLLEIMMSYINLYDLEPHKLHLEITESAYNEDEPQLIDLVNNLSKNGFVIEMDDFGSGYSSLNMLNKLPIDILKIDRGFIKNAGNSESDRAILGFIIQMAKCLKLYVVAEGVEEEQQINSLYNLGCDYVQGFFYSKAVPFHQFVQLLKNGFKNAKEG